MKKNKGLTLKKVADILGVSNATVSNAFNRPDQLSKKRRKEILAACDELGYSGPNQAARLLRKGSSNIVALILPDSLEYMVSDPVANQFMRGVTSVLEKNNLNLLLYSGQSQSIQSVVDFVDGFICYGAPRNPKLIPQLKTSGKRIVTVDFDIENMASVNIDNEQAAYQIAGQAVKVKEDNVAVLGLRLVDSEQICRVYDKELLDCNSSISHRRLDGYSKALAEKGISLRGDRIWNIPESNIKLASLAAREALSCQPLPDVLLCMSDLIALAAIREATAMGLKVPRDIRIVGFDGIEESLRSTPKLTTIHQYSDLKGATAAKLFIDNENHNEVLSYDLQLGDSC
ncbi:LacI family DNA-binding transcriptional regulator [Thalassomonas viridans]|uniref:LacI family DNA-binding transcriptional regulator n=1 Tax=Thalassomonas viridans TaxID=137584 RepID=A0AAE9Z4J4_9GAMM|nr:LacI family DNA-binding transcriptional regulator [Thalassomonas viridans]WDE05904.1 LacI family DNA-binding transcriptional regulator [Thalassomonas viridans]